MSGNSKRVVIVGAGVAGLTLGYLLCRDGYEVVIVEKETQVGGLARSYSYDGFVFDIGPHRFHTDDPEIAGFIREALHDDYLTIQRKSGVWMFNRYFDWPLHFSSLFGMPLPALLRSGLDLLRREHPAGNSFEDYIIKMYGRTLYRIFFKPYTEKFTGVPAPSISQDWAVTGIDRAVIDKKISVGTLSGLLRSILFSGRRNLVFLYPRRGGIQVFSDNLMKVILRRGGSILYGTAVDNIAWRDDRIESVRAGNTSYPCDMLVWTGPITQVLRLLGVDVPRLDYLSLIAFNYRLSHKPLIDYQWCYYGDADIPFNRVSVPTLFNPALSPEGTSGLCVEVTCREGDPVWNDPRSLEPEIRRALRRVKALGDDTAILGVNIERVSNTYPVYALTYQAQRQAALQKTAYFRNLRLLGRTGTFWYNNMDHSIRAAMDLRQEIDACLG